MEFEELKGKTVAQLREIAEETEGFTGFSQMNKDHLLEALCKHLGIDMMVHHHVEGIDKKAVKAKIAERDEVISDLERELAQLRTQFEDVSGSEEDLRRDADIARAEVDRIRSETQTKINALNERIRDLNQQLTGNGKGQSGFFKR